MAGFITFWSKEYIKGLEKAKDNAPWSVIFGSQHSKMPSISSIHVGDTVYPVALLQGTLCVMAKMPVERVEVAFDYLMRETGRRHSALVPDGFAMEIERSIGGMFYQTSHGCVDDPPEGVQILRENDLKNRPHKFHQEPQMCCAKLAASGAHGTLIYPRPLPLECLPELRFGPTQKKEMPLKLNNKGVPTAMSLSSTRRMSEATQEQFAADRILSIH